MRAALVAANLAVALGVAVTYGTDVGRARWHDEATYAALALVALAALPLWRRRRFTTLVLASAGAWSMVTGILLVYVTWRIPSGGWMTWWHAATSAGFVLAFVAHWARNHPRLLGLLAKLRRPAAWSLALAWIALLALAAWTVRANVTEDAALDVATAALVAALLLAAGALAVGRRRRAAPADALTRGRVRGAVDGSLLLAMWLAALTGVALQYAGQRLRAADADWWMYAWHVVVSALLLALALGHAAFNARPLASHARGAGPLKERSS